MDLFISPLDKEKVSTRRIEGTRLSLLRPREIGLTPRALFIFYFNVLLSFEDIEEVNTPFLKRRFGPNWFKQEFPATDPDNEEEVNEIWLAFLSPTILSSRLGKERQYLGLVGYQPNLVARQLGFSQFVPRSLYQNSNEIISCNSGMDEGYFTRRLNKAESESYQINHFPYNTSHNGTLEFSKWWSVYYAGKAKEDSVLLQMINASFDALQIKVSKKKGIFLTKLVFTTLNLISLLNMMLLYIFFVNSSDHFDSY
jgi:hypothetical protein